MSIRGEQVRRARGLLGYTLIDLSMTAGVGETTIAMFERGLRKPSAPLIEAIRRALEEAGVEFLNSGPTGVRMKVRA